MKTLPQQVVLFSGAILILIGVIAAVAQLMGELQLLGMKPPMITEPASGRSAETPQFKV